MTEKIFVKPAEGLNVPLPQEQQTSTLRHLPPEGMLVDDETYWHRRAREGDVTIGEQAVEVPSEPAADAPTAAEGPALVAPDLAADEPPMAPVYEEAEPLEHDVAADEAEKDGE